MTLLVRINLALTACFLLAALVAGGVCHVMLQANAKREVMREAALMVDSALAMRAYTSEEIDPLLSAQMAQEFLPQSVPFYAATQNFLKLREHRPEYAYREATLNPSNPRDRATDWEADIVQQFRNDPHTREIVGERDTPTGRSLYLARPIAAEPECLICHSLASSAPANLLARYGSSNGFGWQPHEIVGAQIVSVPLAAAIVNSERIFHNVMGVIIAILGAVLLMVNVVLYFAVVRPMRRMARLAEEVSLGNSAQGEFPARGSTELVQLARSFNRMRTSLVKALKMLEG
jgi:HAMP domain-containing protein